ncbi:ras-domain-containing protein [Obba rivulosa]|uniref:Ras-domain-containing protein n=1 Tax=Obba rivulosa TaxID=1052685 RepID=A0A8E2DLF1_9APHY|nr:ras-domain-containing protein [Obba rivulosa]
MTTRSTRTIKLVVIGPSGVGKTSLRNQYISGRFTTGYRATIGADFITKTLPHHSLPDESVTLQIWDTAGQERFSSLSSAFFRGADAVLLMFDVNDRETLAGLTRWWTDFREKAPVPDEEAEDFCCVLVGNKIDIVQPVADGSQDSGRRVSEAEALRFMDELVPHTSPHPSPPVALRLTPPDELSLSDTPGPSELPRPRTESIDIKIPQHRHRRRGSRSKSRSHSRSTLFRGGTLGTMTTTHTIFHTPSSSVFDTFESARSSPGSSASTSGFHPTSRSASYSPVRSPGRKPSSSSISSVPTITPSLFVRGNGQAITQSTTPASGASPPQSHSYIPPPPPEKRPKLFFTSAKTGEGVPEVFEYIARRVVMRWEHEEALDARTLHIQDADETIRLGHPRSERKWAASCCGS